VRSPTALRLHRLTAIAGGPCCLRPGAPGKKKQKKQKPTKTQPPSTQKKTQTNRVLVGRARPISRPAAEIKGSPGNKRTLARADHCKADPPPPPQGRHPWWNVLGVSIIQPRRKVGLRTPALTPTIGELESTYSLIFFFFQQGFSAPLGSSRTPVAICGVSMTKKVAAAGGKPEP